MADATSTQDTPRPKTARRAVLSGLVLALLGGAGGFFAVRSGVLPEGLLPGSGGGDTRDAARRTGAGEVPDIAFVPIDPIVISLRGQDTHLRFRAQLEVDRAHEGEVRRLLPRVVDVLNSYLRALETADLADGTSLARLRAQMLRRVQIVTGEGRVNDLLIMEFVLN